MMSALVSRLGSGGGGPAPAGQAKPSAATRRRAEKWAQGLTTRDATAATDTMADVQAALLDAQATSYARCPDVVTVIEATLIAALGNLHASVREAAVVLLNVLYDGHAMQLENALTPAVSSVGEAPVVRLSLPQTDPTQPTVLPKGSLTLRLFGPVDAGRPPRWTTHDVTSTAGGGLRVRLPPFPRPGYYDWLVAHAADGDFMPDADRSSPPDPSVASTGAAPAAAGNGEAGATAGSDAPDAGADPLSNMDRRRLCGRFVVQPAGTRESLVAEVPVDQVGASWNAGTGQLETRGSFGAVLETLPELKMAGATAVYLMGALERPIDEPDAPPMAAADRGVLAKVLGGGEDFAALTSEIRRLGMVPVVDALERVSRRRAHRKYTSLGVMTRDERGVLVSHPGTDGRVITWEESALLNYRKVETWALLISEVKRLARDYGVRGIRLDNAQSCPPIMTMDAEELFRLDPDGVPHYSLSDILYGTVVLRNEESGYWASEAGADCRYANPFLVKLTRELWNEYPTFMVLGESHFHREPQLVASGVVPHSMRVSQILASISGMSLRRDGSVAVLPPHKRSTANTLARLYRADKADLPRDAILASCTCTHASPYPGALYRRRSWIAVDLLFFLPHMPVLLWGEDAGRALRVDMAPVVEVEEDSVYDVNYDAVLPKSPRLRHSGSQPVSPSAGLANASHEMSELSLGEAALGGSASGGGGLRAPPYSSSQSASVSPMDGLAGGAAPPLPAATANATTAGGGRGLGGVGGGMRKRSNSSLNLRSMSMGGRKPSFGNLAAAVNAPPSSPGRDTAAGRAAGGAAPPAASKAKTLTSGVRRTSSVSSLVRSQTTDEGKRLAVRGVGASDLMAIADQEARLRAEIGPQLGFDLSQIRGHYTHRSLMRQQLPALRLGKMVVVPVDPSVKEQVFAFARFTTEQIVVVALNLKDGRDGEAFEAGVNVDLDLRPLWSALPEEFISRRADLFNAFDVVAGAEEPFVTEGLLTLEELMFRRLSLHLRPMSSSVLELRAEPNGSADEHYAQSITRLTLEDAGDIKDPRENTVLSELARGAATSLTAFAAALEKARCGLAAEGLEASEIWRVLQLGLQRASSLLFSVLYEGTVAPKDFVPPVGERLVSFLAMLSLSAANPDTKALARSLLANATAIGPIVLLTPELGRFSTAGGLGVMVDDLAKELAALGLEVHVITPYYTLNRKNKTGYLGDNIRWTRNIKVDLGSHVVEVGIFQGKEAGVNLLFLERGDLLPKVYADPGGAAKHLQTVVLFSMGALEACCATSLVPSVVISNDWLPSMAAGYAKNGFFGPYFDNTSFFHLVHNLGDAAYEGRVYPNPHEGDFGVIHRLPRNLLVDPWWSRVVVNPSRCAFMTSDTWGTVSPNYLKELLAGHPLKNLLAMAKSPFAYPNGIRIKEREASLAALNIKTHAQAKEMVQKKYFGFNAADHSIPLFAFVGRVTSQKGVHLILNAVDELIAHTGGKIQILVGGPANEADPYAAACARHMRDLSRRHKWCFWAAPEEFFTDGLLVDAGADFGFVPSLFEPAGLRQIESFVGAGDGTPVIAHAVGGLVDTVFEWDLESGSGNGFLFHEYNHHNFLGAVKRALRVFSKTDEFAELRRATRTTAIDVRDAAWAWSSEFHRLRNSIYVRRPIFREDLDGVVEEDSEALDPAATVHVVRWTAAGEDVVVKGSWDGWAREWPLTDGPTPIDGEGAEEAADGSVPVEKHMVRLRLPPGDYEFKFKVDGKWGLAKDLPTRGEGAFTNNLLSVP